MLQIRMNECLRLRVHVLNPMLTLKWPKLMTIPPALSTQPLHQICLTLVARMRRKRRCFFFILLLIFFSMHYIFLVFECKGMVHFSWPFFLFGWSLSFQRFLDQSEMGEAQTKKHSSQARKKKMELLLVFITWFVFSLSVENLNFHVAWFHFD